jgi:hypothetical protein
MAGYNKPTKLKLWGNVQILLLNYDVNYDTILKYIYKIECTNAMLQFNFSVLTVYTEFQHGTNNK